MQLAVFFAIAAVVLCLFLKDSGRLYLNSRTPAKDIAISDLCKNGPGDNLFVNVTDLQFTGKYRKHFATNKNGQQTSNWCGTSFEAVSIPTGAANPELAARPHAQPQAEPSKLVIWTNLTSMPAVENYVRDRHSATGMYYNGFIDTKEDQKFFGSGSSRELPLINRERLVPTAGEVYGLVAGLVASLSVTIWCGGKGLREAKSSFAAEKTAPFAKLPPLNPEVLSNPPENFNDAYSRVITLIDMKRESDAIEQLRCMLHWFPERRDEAS